MPTRTRNGSGAWSRPTASTRARPARTACSASSSCVHAYQVVGVSAIESRFEALHGATLTPLVGREEEINLLQRQWHRAKGGEGRVVLLSGEPGIGKSRLTAALDERIENEPHARVRYFCSPQRQDSALHPFIAQIERTAGFEREDTP